MREMLLQSDRECNFITLKRNAMLFVHFCVHKIVIIISVLQKMQNACVLYFVYCF